MAEFDGGRDSQVLECPRCGLTHRPTERERTGSGGLACPECGEETARIIA